MRRIAAVLAVLMGLAACDLGGMTLQPPEGSIVDTETVVVTGELPPAAEPGGTVVVNGVTGTFTGSHTWTAEIPMTAVGYVTVVRAVYTEPDGGRYVQNSALVNGDEVEDGEYSPDGVGMRFTNAGLAGLGPVINDLAGSSFDISGMILAQDPLIPPTDAGAGVTITGKAYEAGSSGVTLDAASSAGGVTTAIAVSDLYIGLDLQLSGLISGACKLELDGAVDDDRRHVRLRARPGRSEQGRRQPGRGTGRGHPRASPTSSSRASAIPARRCSAASSTARPAGPSRAP